MASRWLGAAALGAMLTATAAGAEVLGAADYVRIVEASPLTYVVGERVESPETFLECPRRGSLQRVSGGALATWPLSDALVPLFRATETHFHEGRFVEAAAGYREILAADPAFGPAWLFSGDIPYAAKDWEAALAAYRKAVELDPTLAQGHRFIGDCLKHLGRFDEAEEAYVQALAWDPGYSEALDALSDLWRRRGFRVERPAWDLKPLVGKRKGKKVEVGGGDSSEQLFYSLCTAAWLHEKQFAGRVSRSEDGTVSWSSEMERACVLAAADGATSQAEAQLRKSGAAPQGEVAVEDILGLVPPWTRHLLEVPDAEKPAVLDGFVLFVAAGSRCPMASALATPELHEAVASYIRRFVIRRDEPAGRAPAEP